MKITRVEVYGLFLASLLIGGGGIAYAASGTDTTTPTPEPTVIATADPTPTPVETQTPVDTTTPTNEFALTPERVVDNESYNAQPDPCGGKICGAFIGSNPQTVQLEGEAYQCGWDAGANAGWGWSGPAGPGSPCRDQYLSYVASHCTASDGIISDVKCNEWSTGTLQNFYY